MRSMNVIITRPCPYGTRYRNDSCSWGTYSAGARVRSQRLAGMSPTTAMISRGCPSGTMVTVNLLPRGSSFGQKRRAIASLMIATGAAFAVSRVVKSRPRIIGMRIVLKKCEVTSQ